MKTQIFACIVLIVLTSNIYAQVNTEEQVKLITKLIINDNIKGIKVIETGDIVTDFSKIPNTGKLMIASRYKTWEYWNGVLNTGMLKLYEQFKDEKYKSYSLGNYTYIFDNYAELKKLNDENRFRWDGTVSQLFEMRLLDHCGSMASGLIDAYNYDKRKDYLDYLNKVGDYMLNKEVKLPDGTFARTEPFPLTVWLDDMYMSIPFLARMGKLTGDKKYFDFAAKQVIQFTKYLYDDNSGLYFHCYYNDIKEVGVAHWGRANGWSIFAQANLLEFLPLDHPDRPELLRIYKQQIRGFSRYQDVTGLWHQLLDKQDSYLETSCTAMFTYAVAKGVNEGWIDKRYNTIAIEGWRGIASQINEKGIVENICIGTGTSTSNVQYYTRPVEQNDIHGLGAVVLAGAEMIKLIKNYAE